MGSTIGCIPHFIPGFCRGCGGSWLKSRCGNGQAGVGPLCSNSGGLSPYHAHRLFLIAK